MSWRQQPSREAARCHLLFLHDAPLSVLCSPRQYPSMCRCVLNRHLRKPIKSVYLPPSPRVGVVASTCSRQLFVCKPSLKRFKVDRGSRPRGCEPWNHPPPPPGPPPPLTHQGYSVSPQRPLIALFFTPQLSLALSFIHFSQCWRSLTHISIISWSFFPFRMFFLPEHLFLLGFFLVGG